MKYIKDLGQRFNDTQKTIIAVIVPLIILLLTYVIAEEVDGYSHNAFDFSDTWFVWLVSVSLIGYFEFNFYSD